MVPRALMAAGASSCLIALCTLSDLHLLEQWGFLWRSVLPLGRPGQTEGVRMSLCRMGRGPPALLPGR